MQKQVHQSEASIHVLFFSILNNVCYLISNYYYWIGCTTIGPTLSSKPVGNLKQIVCVHARACMYVCMYVYMRVRVCAQISETVL